MKRLLLATLLVAASLTAIHAQQLKKLDGKSLDGFLDIKWGTSIADATKAMSAKQGLRPATDPEGVNAGNRIYYEGGTFVGKPALQWGLDFVGDKMYRGAVVLKPSTTREKDFDELKKLLTAKYGPPTQTRKEGEDSKLVWKFPHSTFHPLVETLTCWSFKSGKGIKLIYENETLKKAGGAPADEL